MVRMMRHFMASAVAQLSMMTALPDKARLYADEVWFREAWPSVVEVFDDAASGTLHELAGLLFKPDGVAARVIEPALQFLEAHDFTALVAVPVSLDRHMTRWLWLYRFNSASPERVALHDLVNEAGESVLVLLRDERAHRSPIPGTVRLTALKGSSRPERRSGKQLRTHLRNNDRILNFLHSSDEPADLVRELSILLCSTERRRVLTVVRDGGPFTLPRIPALETDEPRLLSLDATLARLRDAFGECAGGAAEHTHTELAHLADRAAAGLDVDRAALRELWQLLGPRDDVDRWDLAVLGVHVIDYDEAGVEQQTLGDAPPELWERRTSRVVTS
jgi:hypothetical protein